MPGLCAAIHALPTIQLALGTTSATGAIPETWFRFGYVPALLSTPLRMQALALDAGQPWLPVALSNDQVAPWPAPPSPAAGQALAWGIDPNATRATTLTTGAVAILGIAQ